MRLGALAAALAVLVFMQATALAETAGWELRSPALGAPPCRAVRHGTTVDTQLLRNRDNLMVLIAGWRSWNQTGDVTASLSIDGGEALDLEAHAVGPIVLVLLRDQALTERVKAARTLHWRLPWADVEAEVEGLGAAYDAIGICPG